MFSIDQVSTQKIRRKIASDGVRSTLTAGLEFVSRKYLVRPIIARAIDRGTIVTVGRTDLVGGYPTFFFGEPSTPPESFVAVLSDAFVLGSTGIVVTDDGAIVSASIGTSDSDARYLAGPFVHHLFRDGVRVTNSLVRNNTTYLNKWAIDRNVISPLIPRYINYYHWMVETLPRLRTIENFVDRGGPKPTLVLPEDTSPWMHESLELAIGDEFQTEIVTNPVYRGTKVVLADRPQVTRENIDWMSDRLRKHALIEPGTTSKRVYISRGDANERHIVNEKDVVEILREYGFQTYQLETMSVEEQIELFTDAEIVIAPHGAGLANIMFCQETTVIELFGSLVKYPFRRLANTLEHEYHAIYCEPRETDLYVDPEVLREHVEKCLQNE